jgi:phosphonate transport system ATP-binding protein
VFDGTPADLTQAAARRIYGAEADDESFSEAVTSTALEQPQPPVSPQVARQVAKLVADAQ